jgi:hypothetical protein
MNPVAYLLVAVALTGGCSATHHGSSQRVPPKQSATNTPTLDTTDASLASETPSCPAGMPTPHSTAAGLATALVPFVATGARVCRYGLSADGSAAHLVGSAKGGTKAIVASLEREMNTFAVVSPSDLSKSCPATDPPMFFVTFYRSASSVDVGEVGGCGQMTNGVRVVNVTPAWRAEMAVWTECSKCRSGTARTVNG